MPVAEAATRTSDGVMRVIRSTGRKAKKTAEDVEASAVIRLEQLKDQFTQMVTEDASVRQLLKLLGTTLKYTAKLIVHHSAVVLVGGAYLIKAFAQLILAILYAITMAVVKAAKVAVETVTGFFAMIYVFATSLVARNGEAEIVDAEEAQKLAKQARTVDA